jgi:copper resistance protein C
MFPGEDPDSIGVRTPYYLTTFGEQMREQRYAFRRPRFGAGLLLAVVALTLLAAVPVPAHTDLSSSDPAPGEELQSPPERVVLRFADPVETAFTPVRVFDRQGRRVDADDTRAGPEPETLVTGLRELPEGVYRVEYRVAAADGHLIAGSYRFTVLSGNEAPTVESTGQDPEIAGEATEEEPETARQEPQEVREVSSTPGGFPVALLYAGLGLAGVAAVGFVLVRRR